MHPKQQITVHPYLPNTVHFAVHPYLPKTVHCYLPTTTQRNYTKRTKSEYSH